MNDNDHIQGESLMYIETLADYLVTLINECPESLDYVLGQYFDADETAIGTLTLALYDILQEGLHLTIADRWNALREEGIVGADSEPLLSFLVIEATNFLVLRHLVKLGWNDQS